MSDWTSGYLAAANISYTYGYYSELNPLRMKLAFLAAGIAFPEAGASCELGFGYGISTNVHAAASGSKWWGTDFNPAQAGLAQMMAKAAGSDAQLFDQAFSEFCARTDLPQFQFIGLHGIWSWISDENRAVIVDFVRRKLAVGGVLYISYNSNPGWSGFAPMRELLAEHAEVMAAPGRGIVNRVDAALDFAEKLLATNPAYARANPQTAERIARIKEQDRHYLAHEYFNRYWDPMSIGKMVEWLEPAKLDFACSANLLDHIDNINLTPAQRQFLADIPDPTFRELVRDFIVNQQFRRDYWVKGLRRLSTQEQTEAMRQQYVMLSVDRPSASLKTKGALGEATMHQEIYDPILDALTDHKTKTVGQIEKAVASKNIGLRQIAQAIMVLASTGQVQPAQDPETVAAATPATKRLNAMLCDRARSTGEVNYLASPVSGGGVAVPRFPQLFLLAQSQGKKKPSEWADFAWEVLLAQQELILKDGKALQTQEENLAELRRQAEEFSTKSVHILKALGIG